MPRRHAAATNSEPTPPTHFFEKDLVGENPPSLATLTELYKLSSPLFEMQAWHVLEESELVLVRDPVTGETCYCSIMGALGEVLAMHAYIGAESYRLLRRMADGDLTDSAEFFASQRSVYVEFVPTSELDAEDKKLLAALGHAVGRGRMSPIFRADRPGYHPWFVTEEEAQTLAECLRAILMICSIVAEQPDVDLWDEDDTYPVISRIEVAGERKYQLGSTRAPLPVEPPLAPARLSDELVRQLGGRDYPVRGVMEIDYFVTLAPIGRKHERKACTCAALAADAQTGILHPPHVAGPGEAPADALAAVFVGAIQATRTIPKELRVRNRRFKDCLAPLFEVCGVPIKVAPLPALDEAKEHLLRFLAGEGLFSE